MFSDSRAARFQPKARIDLLEGHYFFYDFLDRGCEILTIPGPPKLEEQVERTSRAERADWSGARRSEVSGRKGERGREGLTMAMLWPKHAETMDSLWSCSGPAMVAPWPQQGQNMSQPWQHHGLAMTMLWPSHGITMAMFWPSHGSTVTS